MLLKIIIFDKSFFFFFLEVYIIYSLCTIIKLALQSVHSCKICHTCPLRTLMNTFELLSIVGLFFPCSLSLQIVLIIFLTFCAFKFLYLKKKKVFLSAFIIFTSFVCLMNKLDSYVDSGMKEELRTHTLLQYIYL